MEDEMERPSSRFHQPISALMGVYNVDEIDDGLIQERKLQYSTQSIALFVIGGIVLFSLISMNLYMSGWRNGCGKRSQSNAQLEHEERNVEPNPSITQDDNIQFETYSDDNVEMSIEATKQSSQMENTLEMNESNLTRLGRILANYHPKVFDTIRQMSVSNPKNTVNNT